MRPPKLATGTSPSAAQHHEPPEETELERPARRPVGSPPGHHPAGQPERLGICKVGSLASAASIGAVGARDERNDHDCSPHARPSRPRAPWPDGAADLYRRCADVFGAVVAQIGADQLDRPTPCGSWDVRTVLNHVVGEALWLPVLLSGHTIAEVGDRFAGDLLGRDPVGSWRAADLAAREAATAVDEARPIALSYGTVPAEEYLRQVAADHLVHAWDLAQGIGAPSQLPERRRHRGVALVRPTPRTPTVPRVRSARGSAVERDADPQTLLLARFGRHRRRRARTRSSPRSERRSTAMTSTRSWPGRRPTACSSRPRRRPASGTWARTAVRAVWAALFAARPPTRPSPRKQRWVAGDRAVVQWRYDWAGDHPGHVRGVDLFRVRDGLVAEKISYVKG